MPGQAIPGAGGEEKLDAVQQILGCEGLHAADEVGQLAPPLARTCGGRTQAQPRQDLGQEVPAAVVRAHAGQREDDEVGVGPTGAGRADEAVDLAKDLGEEAGMLAGADRIVLRMGRVEIVPEQVHGPVRLGEDCKEQVEGTAIQHVGGEVGLRRRTGDEIAVQGLRLGRGVGPGGYAAGLRQRMRPKRARMSAIT